MEIIIRGDDWGKCIVAKGISKSDGAEKNRIFVSKERYIADDEEKEEIIESIDYFPRYNGFHGRLQISLCRIGPVRGPTP